MKYFMNAALPAQLSLEEFKHVMEALGLRWVQHIPKAEMQLHEEIWELPGDRGIVRYIFDHYVNVPSVRAGSDIRYEPGKILLDLDAHLPFLHYGKLGRMAQSTSLAERKYALRAFASIIKNF